MLFSHHTADDTAFGVAAAKGKAEHRQRVVDAAVEAARAVADGVQALDDLAFGGQALVVGIDVDAGANGGHAHPAVNAVERRGCPLS